MRVSIIGLNETKDVLLLSKKEYDATQKAKLDDAKVFPPEGTCTFKYRVYDEAEYESRLSVVSMFIEEISLLEKENKSLNTENNNLKVEIDNSKLALIPNEHETVINEGLLENKEELNKDQIKEEQIIQPIKKHHGRPKGKKLYEGYD